VIYAEELARALERLRAETAERKRAQEETRANHQRLLSVMDANPDPVYVADPGTYELLYVNRALRDLLGDPAGLKCHEYLQHHAEPCSFCTNDRILGANFGKLYIWDFKNEANQHWYRCVDRGITWPDGRLVRYEMSTDITSRKNAERQKTVSLEVLNILNSVPDLKEATSRLLEVIQREVGVEAAAIRLVRDGDCRYVAHTGFAPDFIEAEDSLCRRLPGGETVCAPDGKPMLECSCGLVIEGRTNPENPLFSPGGSAWTNDSSLIPDVPAEQDPRLHPRNRCITSGYKSVALVPIRTGKEVVGLLQFNDRQPGRFSPESILFLESIAASIGIAIARRKAEEQQRLLHDQLVQAQKMESIGRLAGGVAHDFNNSLYCVAGFSEIILEKLDAQSPLRSDVEQIQRAAYQAADVTKQLLAFSRKQVLQIRPTDLDGLIVSQQKMLHRIIGEDIRIELDLKAASALAIVDPSQFQQVLMNLCVNARDAMPQGGPLKIESKVVKVPPGVEAPAIMAGASAIRVSVIDKGVGMPPEMVDRIFEPFFTTKELGKGTGLGLSVVQGIVKQHGGWIEVASKPGAGTRFDIYLPCAEEIPISPEEEDAPLPKGHGECILLVEDEPIVRQIGTIRLRKLGYTVMEAEGVESGWTQYQSARASIRVLLSDVVLPDGSGVALAERIAAADPAVRIAFSSGYADERSRAEEITARNWLFITKPYNLLALARLIDSMLKEGAG
jgi:signal transduction histidine kinase/CheY-like chemotaxis protein